MAKNNRADGKRSSWYNPNDHTQKKCPTCGGSGSEVDERGRHLDACNRCGGWGQVDK